MKYTFASTHSTTALKSIKSLAPLLDRILVQRIKAETKTAGGIFLPESSVKELNEAKVLAVGPGGLDKDGKRIAPSVAPGDKVLIPQYGGSPVKVGDEEYSLFRDHEVNVTGCDRIRDLPKETARASLKILNYKHFCEKRIVSLKPFDILNRSTEHNMASSSTPSTPLLYSCIAYRTTILTEHTTSASSQTSSLASLILPKIDHRTPQKLTYTHNQNFIHYIADAPSDHPSGTSAGGLTYLVVASSAFGRRIPFGYLVEIKNQFLARYKPEDTDFASLPPYGAAAFNSTLKGLMVSIGTTQAGKEDAIGNVQSEIEDVKGIMTQNIERVLERGERIDLLVDKTDRLGVGAHDFRVRSRGLRRRMWWKNVKLMVLLGMSQLSIEIVEAFVVFATPWLLATSK
ncbi:hypothetical protein MMC34_002671 [Xylographa carneopallida]|nr:hypothetical protein [Xylographa carneopallida]